MLRLACDLALAGAKRIYVVWNGGGDPPDLAVLSRDRRLARHARLEVVTEVPCGDDGDTILVARGDRLFHRDMPKLVVSARAASGAQIGKIAGDEHDGVIAADRATARRLAMRAFEAGGMARVLGSASIGEAELPYAGFTARASGPRALRRAEKQLVWSLRKAADGIASKAINRHISLRISWALSGTKVHPNHITLAALVFALAGAATIASGGYLAGVAGMLLVNVGSIIDGCDGEIARLRFQFSRVGQWLDTTVDDLANIAYISGVIASLSASSEAWAFPIGAVALAAFVITQTTQYALITLVYKSGDLAAIPWAFQSADSLARTSLSATLPKLLKRDFVVTLFCVFAVLGKLDWILVGWATGALVFFVVLFVQLARNTRSLRTTS
ncbi:MAG: CDP-alcohol phosphatidyltransferase family protein [Myxococcota bacterium]|nr:CDP-alcohol phosphatidyltransferase family protein [Myxococcota bacterium]